MIVTLIFLIVISIAIVTGVEIYQNRKKTIVWVIDEATGITETTEESLNQLLADKGVGYKVAIRRENFLQDSQESPIVKIKEMKKKKQQVDVLFIPVDVSEYSGHNLGLEMCKEELLYPMDTYLKSKEGKLLYQQFSASCWKSASVNGKNYGMPTETALVYGVRWHVNKQLMKKYHLKREDFQNKEIWELENILDKVYKEKENSVEDFSSFSINDADILANLPFEQVTDYIGVDQRGKNTTAWNMFDNPYVMKYLKTLHKYAEKGYINRKQELYELSENNFFMYQTNSLIDNEADEQIISVFGASKQTEVDMHVASIPCYKNYYTYNSSNVQQGIASWSKNKEVALKFLNTLATDKDVQMLLNYGKEGKDYKIKKGKVTDMQGNLLVSNSFSQFLSGDCQCTMYKEKLRDNSYIKGVLKGEVLESPINGFSFDDSMCKNELIKLQKIYEDAKQKYFYIFEDDFEQKIAELNQELQENGLEHVLKEISHQIKKYKNDL